MGNDYDIQESMYLIRALGERNPYAEKHRTKPDIVSIGWPDSPITQNLNSLQSYEQNIQNISKSKGRFSKASTDFENFVHKLKEKDIVIIPDGDNIHICRVESVAHFNSAEKDGYPIARKCEFILTQSRSVFSDALQEEFKNGRLTMNLSQYWDKINCLILKNSKHIED